MKVIVPCCGRSSRYPKQPPKWMLPSHDGRPMLALAVSKLQFAPEDLAVVILREHDELYHVTRGLKEVFGPSLRVVALDKPTVSQAETIVRALESMSLDEPFLVKDSDNVFELNDLEQEYNYVCVDSLNNYDAINPRNKSYLQLDHKGVVTNIREKMVISDTFSVGGYYFVSPAQFMEFYAQLSANTAAWQRELYISDIIGAMILEGIPFRARTITAYQDWGTVHEWRAALEARKTFFMLLDGFLFERGSEFLRPRFDEVQPIAESVEAVKSMIAHGHKPIFLSIRPSSFAELTHRQLAAAGFEGQQVVFDCPISSWVLVTAPHATLPFQTSHSLELPPDDPNLAEKILGLR
jgi:dTDP-glucose pyrophosphorylase